jgi:hypothetical protein
LLEQWNFLTDVTDARILAEQLEWAAMTPAVYGHAFNVSNGDLFCWRWLWPQLAATTSPSLTLTSLSLGGTRTVTWAATSSASTT